VALVVTGISQNGDIHSLHEGLRAAGLPTDPIEVVGPDAAAPHLTDATGGTVANPGYMTGSTGQGTGVPGITSGAGTAIGGHGTRYFRNETISDRLGDFEIPDDEIDNYVEAIEAGRSIVGYFAKPETVDQVIAIFRASGLVKVKRF
jgi:hypothetical protein